MLVAKVSNNEQNRKVKNLRLKPCAFDKLSETTLDNQALDFNSTPLAGTSVFLCPFPSSDWGGTPQLLSEQIHPENIKIAILGSELLGLSIAGVDMISDNISKP